MALVLGELGVVLKGNAAKFKGAFDDAGKAMQKFGSGLAGLSRKAAAASSSLSSVGLAGNKSTAHLAVTMRSASELSSKMGVLNKTTYTTTSTWKRFGAAALLTKANLAGVVVAAAQAAAAIAAIGVGLGVSLVYGLARAAAASAEESAKLDGLTSALAQAGVKGARPAAESFADFASKMQQTSRFTDDAIVQAAALGIALKIPHDRLEEVTRVAVDYSTRTGKDLTASFQMIAKAATGQGGALQKAVGTIDQSRLKLEGLSYVLEVLNGQFGGAAAASVANYEGRLIVLKNGFGDLVEAIGSVVEKNKFINAVFVELGNVFADLTRWVQQNRATLSGLLDFFLGAFLLGLKLVAKVVDFVAQNFIGLVAAIDFVLAGVVYFATSVTDSLAAVLDAVAAGAAFLGKTEFAMSAASTAENIRSLGDLGDAFLENGKAAAEMWKGFEDGSLGALASLEEFERRVRSTASTIKDVAPKANPNGGGGAGEVPEFLRNAPKGRGIIGTERAPTSAEMARAAEEAGRARTDRAVGLVKGNVGGIAGNVMKGAENGGGIIGAGIALIASSKQFQQILDTINPLLQSFADVVGAVLAPTREILEAIADPLRELFQVVTPLVELFTMVLTPLVLFQVAAETLGRVIRWVAKGILNAILAFLKGIKRLASKLHIHIGALDDAIDSLKHMRDGLDDVTDAANAAAEALYNVPEGFKIAGYRFGADMGVGQAPGAAGQADDVGGVNLGPNDGFHDPGHPPPVPLPPGYHWYWDGSEWHPWPNGVPDPAQLGQTGNGASSGGGTSSTSSGATSSSGSSSSAGRGGGPVTNINIRELVALDPEAALDKLERAARRRQYVLRGSPLPPDGSFDRKV